MKAFLEWIGAISGVGVIAIGIWVGGVNATAATNTKDIDKLKTDSQSVPVQVAILSTRVDALDKSVQELKEAQNKTAEKIDLALDEMRRNGKR